MAGLGSVSNKVNELINTYLKMHGIRRNKEYDTIAVRIQMHILHDYSGWKQVGSAVGRIEVEEGRLVDEPNRLAKELFDQVNRYARHITYYSDTTYDISIRGYEGELHARV